MYARVFTAYCALLAATAVAQEPSIHVEVSNRGVPHSIPQDDILSDLYTVRADVLQLYTDYASRAGNDLKVFMKNMTGFADEVVRSMGVDEENQTDPCWIEFVSHMHIVEHDARKAASFSGDAHHKFLLGHMIVFRMHINKSDDYLKKAERMIQSCGPSCESTPRVRRWRRLAIEEIHRVRDDLSYTKKSYRDLVSHARRKLHHLKKQALNKRGEVEEKYWRCVGV